MADGDLQSSQQQSGQNERFRGNRAPREGAGRDAGGFRIRLSDNEMRAARAVQEAFGLRSTVAALGLSIRTVAQLLEEGKLDEVLAQHRSSAGSRPPRERRDGPREGGRDGGRDAGRNRPNPFARPARPAAAVVVSEEPAVVITEAEPAAVAESAEVSGVEATDNSEA